MFATKISNLARRIFYTADRLSRTARIASNGKFCFSKRTERFSRTEREKGSPTRTTSLRASKGAKDGHTHTHTQRVWHCTVAVNKT